MYALEPSREADLLELANTVPLLFFRLSAAVERMHADLGLNGPARFLLRTLFLDGEQTAPELAARKPATRQAIQPVLDLLVEKGFVLAKLNPRHKRSHLYVLTPAGIDACVAMQRREVEELSRLATAFDPDAVASAAQVIRQFTDGMNAYLAETELA